MLKSERKILHGIRILHGVHILFLSLSLEGKHKSTCDPSCSSTLLILELVSSSLSIHPSLAPSLSQTEVRLTSVLLPSNMYTEPSCVATTLLSNTPRSASPNVLCVYFPDSSFWSVRPLTEGSNNGCGWLHHRSVASSKQTWTWSKQVFGTKTSLLLFISFIQMKEKQGWKFDKMLSLTFPTYLLPYRFKCFWKKHWQLFPRHGGAGKKWGIFVALMLVFFFFKLFKLHGFKDPNEYCFHSTWTLYSGASVRSLPHSDPTNCTHKYCTQAVKY